MSAKTIMILTMSVVAVVLSLLNGWMVITGSITLTNFLLGQVVNMMLACTAVIIGWLPKKDS